MVAVTGPGTDAERRRRWFQSRQRRGLAAFGWVAAFDWVAAPGWLGSWRLPMDSRAFQTAVGHRSCHCSCHRSCHRACWAAGHRSSHRSCHLSCHQQGSGPCRRPCQWRPADLRQMRFQRCLHQRGHSRQHQRRRLHPPAAHGWTESRPGRHPARSTNLQSRQAVMTAHRGSTESRLARRRTLHLADPAGVAGIVSCRLP